MEIAIIGAGVGGLASAVLLSRGGHTVTIFDKFDHPKPVGSGLVIQPVGLRILQEIGAADKVLNLGNRLNSLLGYEAKTGQKILDVSYASRERRDAGTAIHRASLFDALYDVVTELGVPVVTQAEIARTTLSGDKRLLFDSQGGERGAYDLVIDCSGAGSKLSPINSRQLSYGAIWGTVDWPDDCQLAQDRLEQRYRQAKHMIGILPIGKLPDGETLKTTIFWSLPQASYDQWRAADLAAWRAQATELWPEIAPFVSQINDHDQMTMARYSHGTLSRLYTERLVYIGDAAHRASPQLGQGANMALLDAYALCHYLNSHPLKTALPRFRRSRLLHIRVNQLLSATFTPMYQSNSRVLPYLRDYILTPSTYLPGIPAFLRTIVKGEVISPFRDRDLRL